MEDVEVNDIIDCPKVTDDVINAITPADLAQLLLETNFTKVRTT